LETTTTLQSRLGSVMDTFETHIKDHRHHQAAKALQRTETVQQLNLTNTQLTRTWECAKDVSHDLITTLKQLEGIVDALLSPTPPMSTSPPYEDDILTPQPSSYKRSCFEANHKDIPSALVDLQRLTLENLLASRILLQAQNKSDSIHRTLLDANLAFKNMQGQAKSEDGNIDIPTVFYQDEGVSLTPTSKPTRSNTSPSPPSLVMINTTLLDANLTFKNMQGQAKSEDGKVDIRMAKLKDVRVPFTQTSKPNGSTTPQSPPSAPLPPPPCQPPLSEYYKHSKYVQSVHVSTSTTAQEKNILNRWLNGILSTINPPYNDMQTHHHHRATPCNTQSSPPQYRHNNGQCFGCNSPTPKVATKQVRLGFDYFLRKHGGKRNVH
jgi:hypothetical protein